MSDTNTFLKVYNKIVRDGMERIVRGGGFRLLRPDEKKQLLREKLIEEALEQVGAQGDEKELEELADLYAVIEELSLFYGGMEALKAQAALKEAERGGFKKGLYLIYAQRTKRQGEADEALKMAQI